MEQFLSPLENVSANPGCECFSLTFDGGFNSNVNVGDVPEIEFTICDSMPVVINTDVENCI